MQMGLLAHALLSLHGPCGSACAQTLLLEADPSANDLDDGDSGIVGRTVKRKSTGGSKKRKKGVRYYMGHEWTEEEEDQFQVRSCRQLTVGGV